MNDPQSRRRRDARRRPLHDDPEPHRLTNSLSAFLASQGMSSVNAVAQIAERWPTIVGEQIAAHARPVKIVDGELLIAVDHPAWATELRLLSGQIVGQLAEGPEIPEVRGLKVHVRN